MTDITVTNKTLQHYILPYPENILALVKPPSNSTIKNFLLLWEIVFQPLWKSTRN